MERDFSRIGMSSEGDLGEHVLEQRQGIRGSAHKSCQTTLKGVHIKGEERLLPRTCAS
jgi:hypothetical protein